MIVHNDKTFAIYCIVDNDIPQLNSLPQIYSIYKLSDNHNGSLDFLKEYMHDLSAQYFIYTKNIKSDYVGFCQPDGIFEFDIDNFINENGICYGHHTNATSWTDFHKYIFLSFLKKDLHEYISRNYKTNSRIYKAFITKASENVNYYIGRRYICKWEFFTEIMGFVVGFINYINAEYKLNWDEQEWHYFILDNFIDKKLTKGIGQNETYWFNNGGKALWCIFPLMFEIMIGVYFGHLVNEFNLPQYEIKLESNPDESVKS